MNLRAFETLRKAGVLGMNRRNADYIMRFNPRLAFPLVDDKIATKRLAEAHEIPTPSLYHVIGHHGDIGRFEKAFRNLREFAVKPARGSGGSGILLIVDSTPKGFIAKTGQIIPWADLRYHLSDILSGIYSLEGLEDQVLVEALVHPAPVFDAVAYRGVPDVRILVYRGVPTMGMVRLPSRASDGKANLHRGAIGVGIDMSSGTTLLGVHHSRVTTHHPDTGNPVSDIQIPHWETMLQMAARAFDMTRLGYIGVDLVIDQEQGPLLLELNARPGLQIQIANQAGLIERLDLIDKAPLEIFGRPETRSTWARKTFSLPNSKS